MTSNHPLFLVNRYRKHPKLSRKQRAMRFFEQLEERQVLSVTWDVQTDFFGTRDVVSQSRSLRSIALASDDQHIYAGFLQGTASAAIREVGAGVNTSLIGNGAPGSTYGSNPAYSTGLEASLVTFDQPRGMDTDDRGYVYTLLSGGSNRAFAIYTSDFSAQIAARSISNPSGGQVNALATAELGSDYYVYIGWQNGLIERWNVTNHLNPTLDTSWGLANSGKINLKSYDAEAYVTGLAVDSDGTLFVTGGLQGTTSFGDALIKIPAIDAATGSFANTTFTEVHGGANGTGGYSAMDVALYAGKAYVTQYLQTNSTIQVFYTLDLSFAEKITPPIDTLIGPSGKVSEYNSDAGSDSGFSGIDISADGKIYLAEQLYNYVPSNGYYTPPGGLEMTGTRIYFDRILVSSPVDVEGPVTSVVTAVPNPVVYEADAMITLTASVSDVSTSGSTIAGAEFSVDGGTTWFPMMATDGVFDEVSEEVTMQFTLGDVGISGIGFHTILVRGIDTANQTGLAAQTILKVEGSAPVFDSVDTATFVVGIFGTFTIETTAVPTASITLSDPLPGGVSLVDNGDGTATLSGTPGVGTQGSYTLTLTASNGVLPDATQSFTLIIDPPSLDFGDAPISYGTLLENDGARHANLGPKLGLLRDTEANGQPSNGADGDGDDEDGVILPSAFIARVNAQITVNSTGNGRLDGWIDFNGNGMFDSSEQIATGLNVQAGPNTFTIAVPANITPGLTYARFRLSTLGVSSPTGLASDGEVEDYAVTLVSPAYGSVEIVDDPENPGHGLLLIRGTNGFYETITVQPTSGQPGKVTASVSTGATVAGIDLNSFDRIVIFGEAGFDQISVANSITKPATIYGDDGFDIINGGGGNDIIDGGPGFDMLNGNGGDDTFINHGGGDSLNGGAGIDTLVKHGSGLFNVSSFSISNGADFIMPNGIEKVKLIGGAGADTFNFNGWNGEAEVDGGGGSNTIIYSADGNFVLQEGQLTRTIGANTVTIQFANITNAQLTGGFGNNSFDLTNWPNPAVVDGGFFGTDSITVAGDVDYTLSAGMLTRGSLGQIRLAGLENATLIGGASDNTFDLVNWTGAATLNGLDGSDKIVAGGNVNMTLTDTSLVRTNGGLFSFMGPGGPYTLFSIERAELIGGAGNNTIDASGFSGEVKIDGGAGNDIITSGSGIALLLGGAGNDILNAGSGRTVMIGGLGTDSLNGGSGDDLLIDGTTIYDNSAVALAAILAEWASAASYSDRVDHLTGTPGGLNGTFHLSGNNVIHDTAVDTLFGGDGDDLFFAKLDAGNTDILGDQDADELAL
jgi:WD40 repeat protein